MITICGGAAGAAAPPGSAQIQTFLIGVTIPTVRGWREPWARKIELTEIRVAATHRFVTADLAPSPSPTCMASDDKYIDWVDGGKLLQLAK